MKQSQFNHHLSVEQPCVKQQLLRQHQTRLAAKYGVFGIRPTEAQKNRLLLHTRPFLNNSLHSRIVKASYLAARRFASAANVHKQKGDSVRGKLLWLFAVICHRFYSLQMTVYVRQANFKNCPNREAQIHTQNGVAHHSNPTNHAPNRS